MAFKTGPIATSKELPYKGKWMSLPLCFPRRWVVTRHPEKDIWHISRAYQGRLLILITRRVRHGLTYDSTILLIGLPRMLFGGIFQTTLNLALTFTRACFRAVSVMLPVEILV